jgi:DNA-binding IclR family transcriptional regulator
MLATLSGTSVLLRQTTDASSPLASVRYSPGYRAPILDRASGLVLLAFSSHAQRQMVLDLLYRDHAAQRESGERAEVERRLRAIRNVGYACLHSPAHPADRSSLAVPVQAGSDTLAALVVRFARSAVRPHVMMDRFLPALRAAAHDIVDRFNQSSHSPVCADIPPSLPPSLRPSLRNSAEA